MKSRQIKFRAWDKISKEMYEPFELSEGLNECAKSHHAYGISPEHYVYLQFTGLLDRHGKEIYEGDIITTGTKTGDVRFKFGCWHFFEEGISYLLYPKETELQDGGKLKWFEIIGNIYQNPELLK